MARATSTELRIRFRELIAGPELTVIPGAYDALSARAIARAGFCAVGAGGYAAIGSMLAEDDGGQSNMRDYADHYSRLANAVDIPVYVDADTGFGGPRNVAHMIRAFENAGVAGLFISDQSFPNRCGYMEGKSVVPVGEMLDKLKAALDARRDSKLFIGSRTDVCSLEGLSAAIDRCQRFLEVGVDMAKPQGADTPAEIERVMAEVPCPHFATLSNAALSNTSDLADLRQLHVAAVTLPSLTLFAAAKGVTDALEILRRNDSVKSTAGAVMATERYYSLVGR